MIVRLELFKLFLELHVKLFTFHIKYDYLSNICTELSTNEIVDTQPTHWMNVERCGPCSQTPNHVGAKLQSQDAANLPKHPVAGLVRSYNI